MRPPDRPAADGPFEQLSIRDFLTMVFKRRALIVAVTAGVFVLVTGVTLMRPRTYEVASTLLVNEARAEVPMAPTESQQVIINQVTEEDLNSEIEVLRSRSLVEGVVRSLLAQGVEPPRSGSISTAIRKAKKSTRAWLSGDGAQGVGGASEVDELALLVGAGLDVTAVRRSNVIRIVYESTDPQWTTRVVATMVDHYLKERAQRYQSPQVLSFFSEQMKEAENQLLAREQALEDLAISSGITMVEGPEGTESLAAQKAVVMDRLARLEGDLANSKVDYEATHRKVTNLRQQLAQVPERLESANRMNQDAATEEIERAIAQLELERDRLLQDFRPDSRYVRDVEARISRAEEQLARAREAAGVNRTEINPVHTQLRGELVSAEAEFAGITARVALLDEQARKARGELSALNSKSFDIETLRRDARVAEETYLLFHNKHEEARISAAMDQEQFINVTIAQPAQMPLLPVGRRLVLKMALGLMIGLMGGLGSAFAIDQFFDRSFTTAQDIERRLGLAHLASIPDSARLGQ